jgi:hypothetical protein
MYFPNYMNLAQKFMYIIFGGFIKSRGFLQYTQNILKRYWKRRPAVTVTTGKKDALEEWMPAMTMFANNDMSEFGQPPEMKHLLYMSGREVEDYRRGDQRPTTWHDDVFPNRFYA